MSAVVEGKQANHEPLAVYGRFTPTRNTAGNSANVPRAEANSFSINMIVVRSNVATFATGNTVISAATNDRRETPVGHK